MRITTKAETLKFTSELGDAKPGDCVAFETIPHSKHADDSIFVVLRVPSQYIKYDERRTGDIFRIMVANLATGDCSLMIQTRKIRGVDAEVVNNES